METYAGVLFGVMEGKITAFAQNKLRRSEQFAAETTVLDFIASFQAIFRQGAENLVYIRDVTFLAF